jgi:hypothetical protein
MEPAFKVQADCKLFFYVAMDIPAGESISVTSDGEPVGGGLILTPSFPVVESGALEVTYQDHAPYVQDTFTTISKVDPEARPGVRPSGIAILRALTDVTYGCARPKDGKSLDYAFYDGTPINPPVRPAYIIPLKGTCEVGGVTLNTKEIGRRDEDTPIALDPSEGAEVAVIWERT